MDEYFLNILYPKPPFCNPFITNLPFVLRHRVSTLYSTLHHYNAGGAPFLKQSTNNGGGGGEMDALCPALTLLMRPNLVSYYLCLISLGL